MSIENRKNHKKIFMHRLAYARAQAGARVRRRARNAGELLAVRRCRKSGAGAGAGFCLLPSAGFIFCGFSAFSVFLDKFIGRAAFFKNRRQFCGLLALRCQSGGTDSKKNKRSTCSACRSSVFAFRFPVGIHPAPKARQKNIRADNNHLSSQVPCHAPKPAGSCAYAPGLYLGGIYFL